MDRKAPLWRPQGYAASASETFRTVSVGNSVNRGNGPFSRSELSAKRLTPRISPSALLNNLADDPDGDNTKKCCEDQGQRVSPDNSMRYERQNDYHRYCQSSSPWSSIPPTPRHTHSLLLPLPKCGLTLCTTSMMLPTPQLGAHFRESAFPASR